MSSTEKSEALESLISLLEENEKRLDSLANKIDEKNEIFDSLFSLLEENEKRVDTLANKLVEKSDVIDSLLTKLKENKKRLNSFKKKSDAIGSLFTRLEENEKRVTSLENNYENIESSSVNSAYIEVVNENDSLPVKMPKTRSILVVDDDKKLAASFKLILESAGYVVDMAHNGFSAHIKITQNTYDLVLLDWHLQDVIGDQIAETIEKRTDETKIIFITGYSYLLDEFDRENEILLKPIEPNDLLETVANNIAQ